MTVEAYPDSSSSFVTTEAGGGGGATFFTVPRSKSCARRFVLQKIQLGILQHGLEYARVYIRKLLLLIIVMSLSLGFRFLPDVVSEGALEAAAKETS